MSVAGAHASDTQPSLANTMDTTRNPANAAKFRNVSLNLPWPGGRWTSSSSRHTPSSVRQPTRWVRSFSHRMVTVGSRSQGLCRSQTTGMSCNSSGIASGQ